MPRLTQMPPPGIMRGATPEASQGHWFDCNNMRWRGGVLQPIGGNVLIPGSAVPTVPRDILCWHDLQYHQWAAIGTDDKLFAYSFDLQTIYDITPTGVGPLSPPGQPNGYGLGTYGTGLYGMPRSPAGAPPPGIIGNYGDTWSMDTFGELLLVVPTQQGSLYSWDPTTPTTVATIVANAPVNNRGVVVTDQRQVVLYGAGGDPRAVAWSDQESLNVWAPDVTNLAGSKQLVTQAAVMCAVKQPSGVVIFTTNDVHLMQYVGPPYAYGITQIAAGCGPISPRAVVSQGSFCTWPSWQNWWQFSGNVSPLVCDVKDWFFATLSHSYGGATFGSNNSQYAEIWWDFPDEGSGGECTTYVAFNYAAAAAAGYAMAVTARPIWQIGTRARTAADRNGTLTYPVLGGISGSGGGLFQHELGYLDNGNPRASAGEVYATTGAIVLGEGDTRYHVKQVVFDGVTIPDQPAVAFEFYAKEQPFAQTVTTAGPYTQINANGLLDVRFSGRTVQMRVQATRDVGFEVGQTRLSISPAGKL